MENQIKITGYFINLSISKCKINLNVVIDEPGYKL